MSINWQSYSSIHHALFSSWFTGYEQGETHKPRSSLYSSIFSPSRVFFLSLFLSLPFFLPSFLFLFLVWNQQIRCGQDIREIKAIINVINPGYLVHPCSLWRCTWSPLFSAMYREWGIFQARGTQKHGPAAFYTVFRLTDNRNPEHSLLSKALISVSQGCGGQALPRLAWLTLVPRRL